MRSDLLAAVRALVVPTLALVGVAVFAPGRAELALRVYALLLAGVGIAVVLAALRRAYPPETALHDRTARREPSVRPSSLTRLEHEAALGIAGSFDLHFRLAPRVREIADGLLRARHGLSIAADPERARTLLGEDVWQLVRSDRPAPVDRLASGIDRRDLARAIAALERV